MKNCDIISILFIVIGTILVLFFISTLLFMPYYILSAVIPFAAGIAFLVIAILRLTFKNKKFIKIFTNILIGIGIGIFFITQCLIFSNINSDIEGEFDYLMVLGCSLYNDIPSESLKMRLDKALEYAKRYPDCKIIVSGGQGDNETIPESMAMKIYLTERGISEERIIQESNSRNTIQNFQNSKRILDELHGNPDYVIAFVTAGFHIYRSKMIARELGLTYYGISAPYPLLSSVFDHIRETASIVVFFIKCEGLN